MIKILTALIVSSFLLSGCGNYLHWSPTTEEVIMKFTGEPEVEWITSEEAKELLPSFSFILPGKYKLVPRGLITKLQNAPWCSPKSSELFRPVGWDCQDYSYDVLESFDNKEYAIGVAWYENEEKTDGHMVVIYIDDKKKVILYEPQECDYTRMSISGICFGTGCLSYQRGVGRNTLEQRE